MKQLRTVYKVYKVYNSFNTRRGCFFALCFLPPTYMPPIMKSPYAPIATESLPRSAGLEPRSAH